MTRVGKQCQQKLNSLKKIDQSNGSYDHRLIRVSQSKGNNENVNTSA